MKMSKSVQIDAPASVVWHILAHEFEDVAEWASGVSHSVVATDLAIPEGADVGGRVCTVPDLGNLTETFTHFDEDGKNYTFEAEGMPFFITRGANTWAVEAMGENACCVSFQLEMEFMPVIGVIMRFPMQIQINTLLQNAIEELKYYVETGKVHPRKEQAMAKVLHKATAN